MKRILILAAAIMLCGISVSAEKIGDVISTDIVTFIDGSPIESYNYLDYTYVVAEDLRNYGFNADWNADERRLDITRPERNFTPYIDDFVNEIKSDNLFAPVFGVYTTDIKTYINGEPVQSYNIYGKTIINTDALQAFGICTYDNEKRRYDVDILSREIEDCEERVIKEEEYDGFVTGEVQKGFFDGDNLIYGIDKKVSHDRFGESVVITRGDFEGKLLAYVKDYVLPNGEICAYSDVNNNEMAYVVFDDDFRYGRYVTTKKSGDGRIRYYAEGSGELYLEGTGNTDEGLSFDYAKLYRNGKQVAEGEAKKDTLSIDGTDYDVLYMPGYTDSDGEIWFYPEEGGGYVFYRGNVVNGVAHGEGRMYRHEQPWETETDSYAIIMPETSPIVKTSPSRLIYDGHFADGLPDGYGKIFDYGLLKYDGDMAKGKKNGHGREYSSWSADMVYLEYEGGFENGRRSGEGAEYGMTFDGVWKRFEGNWHGGNWESGKWYELNAEGQPELYYEGEFRYDGERQYGTAYKYYNEETGEYEVKTGWFANWEYIGE